MQMKRKKIGVAILTSDKIDFKTKYSKRQRRMLHNDKGNNSAGGYNNSKHLCTQYRGIQICIANLDGQNGRDGQKYSHSQGF